LMLELPAFTTSTARAWGTGLGAIALPSLL